MQNVPFFRVFASFSYARVDPHLFPTSQHFGLILRKVGLHGKPGFRQIDGGFQVEWHSAEFSQMVDFFHYREQAFERLLIQDLA